MHAIVCIVYLYSIIVADSRRQCPSKNAQWDDKTRINPGFLSQLAKLDHRTYHL